MNLNDLKKKITKKTKVNTCQFILYGNPVVNVKWYKKN